MPGMTADTHPDMPLGVLKSTPSATPNAHAPAVLKQKYHSVDGLYLHVPFCFHKCHYCDFYSVVDHQPTQNGIISPSSRQDTFAKRLIAELELRSGQVHMRPSTVFVGGGTPTLLHPDLWRDLLDTIEQLGVLSRVVEFTVEANPETVSAGLMDTLVSGGVNRISVGSQSFNPDLLKALERWHDPRNVTHAVLLAKAVGIHSVNIDMIFGIPGQTLVSLDKDIDSALRLSPDHISYYGLTYEPNTPMTHRLKQGEIKSVEVDLEQRMYERVIDRLEREGYEHYEVSNWAKPGQRCKHNLVYWENGDWLGVGPGAASHIAGYRWKNKPHLGECLANRSEPPTTDHESLPPQQQVGERLMLMLRLREGAPQEWVEQNLPQSDARHGKILDFIALGLLEWRASRLRLTRRGLMVADSVLSELL